MKAFLVFAFLGFWLWAATFGARWSQRVNGEVATKRRKLWEALAQEFGLESEGSGGNISLRGVVDGCDIHLGGHGLDGKKPTIGEARLLLFDDRLPDGLIAAGRHFGSALALGVDEPVPTGDAAFDGAALVDGDPLDVSAVFDASTRRQVLVLVKKGEVWLKGDGVQGIHRVSSHKVGDPGRVLRDGLALASHLRLAPDQREPRLVEIAGSDPNAAVRRRCLDLLATHFPQNPEIPALRESLETLQEHAGALSVAGGGEVGLAAPEDAVDP